MGLGQGRKGSTGGPSDNLVFLESESMFSRGYSSHHRQVWRKSSKGISKDLFFFFWSEMKRGRRGERRARSPAERNSLFFIFSNDLVCFILTWKQFLSCEIWEISGDWGQWEREICWAKRSSAENKENKCEQIRKDFSKEEHPSGAGLRPSTVSGEICWCWGEGWLLWVWMGHDGELGIARTCMSMCTCMWSRQGCVFCAKSADARGALSVCSAPQPGAVCSIVHLYPWPLLSLGSEESSPNPPPGAPWPLWPSCCLQPTWPPGLFQFCHQLCNWP